MLYEEKFPLGKVEIRKNVIARIVQREVDKLQGKVIITNYKGKASSLMNTVARKTGQDYKTNMEIVFGNQGLDIRVYVIVKFGVSIRNVTSTLINSIQESVRENTGLEANSIAIAITGTFSKNVAKRNIEVRG